MSLDIAKPRRTGTDGTLKVIAALAMLSLAGLSGALVIGGISPATFTDVSIKVVSLLGIVGLVCIAFAVLLRPGR